MLLDLRRKRDKNYHVPLRGEYDPPTKKKTWLALRCCAQGVPNHFKPKRLHEARFLVPVACRAELNIRRGRRRPIVLHTIPVRLRLGSTSCRLSVIKEEALIPGHTVFF